MVWVFGEAFGGIFAPGLTWLFGAPGAVLVYCVAGVVLALPEDAFATARLGRLVLRLSGAFLVGMAVLQAWPGRGFWQGRGGTLDAMVTDMAQTPQPHLFASWVTAFGAFDAAHGWAVNLFVVVSTATTGALLMSGRRRPMLVGLAMFLVLAVAAWVLIEDLGFFGGLGTDPNSMLPLALLFVAAYVGVVRVPATAPARAGSIGPEAGGHRWWQVVTAPYLARSLAALAALAIVLVGTAPMARAAIDANADPILSEALDGTPNSLDSPAPPFSLADQYGRPVSLASLRGHVVALTFLDPVCTSDCPLIAQEFRNADQQLAERHPAIDFVAVVSNPIYRSVSFVDAFDRQEGLTDLSNWYFLTGTVAQLQQVWNSYGELVQVVPGGAMVAHSDLAFVIDGRGHERDALVDDPGPDRAYASSFSTLLEQRIEQVLGS